MKKKQTALTKARSALKKAEGAHTPNSIKAKLKNAADEGNHKEVKTQIAAKRKGPRKR